MKILVTGAAGYIGRQCAVRQLFAQAFVNCDVRPSRMVG